MKLFRRHIVSVLILPFVFVTACSHMSTAQKDQVASAAGNVGAAALNGLQWFTEAAAQLVVTKALSSADLSAKTDLLSSAAQGLRTLEGSTGGIVTPDIVGATIEQFTDPTKSHWGTLATDATNAYIQAQGTQDQKLETVAQSLDKAVTTVPAVAAAAAAPTSP